MVKFLRNLLFLYLVSGIIALLMFAFFSWSAGDKAFEGMTYNKAFTFHFFIMIFLFIIPAIPSLIYSSFKKKEDEID